MRKRAELFAHIQNTASQYNHPEPLGRIARPRNWEGTVGRFALPCVRKSIEANLEMITTCDRVISGLESYIIKSAKNHDPVSYALLKSIHGVARIIGLDLLYEIEGMARFPKVQDFVSSGR